MNTRELLRAFCSAMVPLTILEIKAYGGPDEEDFARIRGYAPYLGAHGDGVLYRTGHTGQAVSKVAEALAILAFCPGGVTFLDLHFEATASEGHHA